MNTDNFKTIEESKGLWWKTAKNGNKYISTTFTIEPVQELTTY